MERLYHEGNLNDENNLALAYRNRGGDYTSLARYDEALEDYNKSIEIWKKMKTNNKIIHENDLAIAYINKAIASSKAIPKEHEEHFSKEGSEYNNSMINALLKYRKKQLDRGDN